eukprot:3714241-Amphidinium_carterae.1
MAMATVSAALPRVMRAERERETHTHTETMEPPVVDQRQRRLLLLGTGDSRPFRRERHLMRRSRKALLVPPQQPLLRMCSSDGG